MKRREIRKKSPRCWNWWNCPGSNTAGPLSYPEACANAWGWLGQLFTNLKSCFTITHHRADPVVSNSIDKLILRVRDRLKVTTVVVTHDMRSARRVGQRILMLHDRKIYVAGTPDEIFNSTDPVVHRFVNGISVPKEHLEL